MPFSFKPLEIHDVILIEAKTFEDDRGYFSETYKRSEFEANGISNSFVQDNYSHSIRGVLRGLHYQKDPMAQGKLVCAIRGEIFDVAVDIRRESATYGEWVGVVLSDENHRMLWVPRGFAHGFCATSDKADVVYKVDNEYSPEHDRGIIWNDPDIGVEWPVIDPLLSDKDRELPKLSDADNNF